MVRLLMLLCLVVVSSPSFAVKVAPGEYIVRFRSVNAAKSFYANKTYANYGEMKWLRTSAAPMQLFKARDLESLKAGVRTFRADPAVAYVEPNYIVSIPAGFSGMDKYLNSLDFSPSDSRFKELWGLKNTGQLGGVPGIDINMIPTWGKTRGDSRVRIAIIDTGIDYRHPDIAANMWKNPREIPGNGMDDDGNGYIDDVYGYDFVNKDGDPMDDNRHGTHCAGTIGAVHDKEGVAGVMGRVQLMGLKFLSAGGSGKISDAVEAVEYATKMGVHVMSNSWGGGGHSVAMFEAINKANEAGIVFVAAAGNARNDNDARPFYPAGYQLPNVISVAAMDNKGNPASFTNFGKTTVHVAAPGVGIVSTIPGGQYQSLSGTSMACPHVSGVVGLVLATNGIKAAQSMRTRLMRTSRPHEALKTVSASGGFVDALAAIRGQR